MSDLHISGGFFDALDGYVQAVVTAVPQARSEGIRTLHADIQRRARNHPRWEGLADHIETWQDKSGTHIGVRDPEHVEAARSAEYGDAGSPPAPLLRHMPGSMQKAAERTSTVLRSHLGIPSY